LELKNEKELKTFSFKGTTKVDSESGEDSLNYYFYNIDKLGDEVNKLEFNFNSKSTPLLLISIS
jgi:hypothetical protein